MLGKPKKKEDAAEAEVPQADGVPGHGTDRREKAEKTPEKRSPLRRGAKEKPDAQAKTGKVMTRREQAEAALAASRKRMSLITGVSVAIAVAGAAFGGFSMVQTSNVLAKYSAEAVRVVVATEDIAPGDVLTADKLEVVDMPGKYAPADAAKKVEEVAGHRTIASVTAGIPIQTSTVEASEHPMSISTALEEGQVAYMASLDSANAVSPLLSVGDHVDVYAISSDGLQSTSEILASDVRVIALDGRLSGAADGTDYTRVTLALTREQAQAAHGSGSIRLVAVGTDPADLGPEVAAEDQAATQDQAADAAAGGEEA